MKVAILVLATIGCAASSHAQETLREKLDAIYERGRYQRDLPLEDAVETDPGEDSGVAGRSGTPPPADPPPVPVWLRESLGWVATALPWIAIGLLGTLFLVVIIRSRGRRRNASVVLAGTPAGPPAAAGSPAGSPLVDAEALAAQAMFAEAIHAILLKAIDRVRAKSPEAVAPSLTSREVTASAALPADEKAALARLVHAVETTLFGGRPASEGDYAAAAADLGRIGAPA